MRKKINVSFVQQIRLQLKGEIKFLKNISKENIMFGTTSSIYFILKN